ncbi:hypothetical protein H6P81_015902 [Aristolochia fimbriata]|uniref:Uncharacterized protein n=1 Tax=Aristolochia fimbriata TaxID=158543 RepID=A0AAV7E6U9_ARIFI|nr:hypothetical protein H6P81_015902 [Aristolochia fimbriata]
MASSLLLICSRPPPPFTALSPHSSSLHFLLSHLLILPPSIPPFPTLSFAHSPSLPPYLIKSFSLQFPPCFLPCFPPYFPPWYPPSPRYLPPTPLHPLFVTLPH